MPDTEQPPPADQAVPSAPARHGVALAAVVLLVALTAPFWQDAALSRLGVRTPAARAAAEGALAAMQQERRIDDLSRLLAAATDQLARQQVQLAAAMRRADAVTALVRTFALVRLADTLRRPLPFAGELAMVRADSADPDDLKPLLDQIEPYADTGIPGTAQLGREFTALVDHVARGGSRSWMASLAGWARLRGTPPATAGADPSPELLQAASERLADADLAGALARTRQLSDAYRPVFAGWIDDAQARVAADAIAAKVSEMVAETLQTRIAR